ncbi:MAG: hypothetical protein AAGF26_04365, partial [Cyanobacteria bacterium P01_G01_bin.49]
ILDMGSNITLLKSRSRSIFVFKELRIMNQPGNLIEELENLTKKSFYFCLGTTQSILQETQNNLQKLSENTQNFVQETIEIGENSYHNFANNEFNSYGCKYSVSYQLRQRMFTLVKGDWALAERLIASEKQKHPNHRESWYWEKVIYDLERH